MHFFIAEFIIMRHVWSVKMKKFKFDKIIDYYYLFLTTAEMNLRACQGQMELVEYYEDLYNDIIYDVPYRLFLKKLMKQMSYVTEITDEHEKEILLYFKDVLDIMPCKTKKQIESIITGPFEFKRLRKEKKKNQGLTLKIIKEFFKEN